MNLYEKVLRAEYKPQCYVLISFERDKTAQENGETRAKPIMSFLYDSGEIAAEWCPPYGPIQIWRKAEENKRYSKPTLGMEADVETVGAQPHYAYPFVIPRLAEWSQLSVERHELSDSAIRGYYQYIFDILKEWAESR